MYLLAQKFGFADEMFKNIKVENNEPLIEDITREFNKGMWTIGYTGQSPERLRLHMANQHTFDKTTLQARTAVRPTVITTVCPGHPGVRRRWATRARRTSTIPPSRWPKAVSAFRARFGVEREGDNLLAEGSYPVGSEIKDGYPEFTMAMLKKLGWDGDLTAEERRPSRRSRGDKTNWKTDLSGGIQRVAIKHGCAPFGNAKARAVVWNFPDPVPLHREPLYTSGAIWSPTIRPTKIAQMPIAADPLQVDPEEGLLQGLPDHPDLRPAWSNTRAAVTKAGRTPGWPSCSRTCSSRSIPSMPTNTGIRDGERWSGCIAGRAKVKVMAMVTERVGRGVAFMPFHFGGHMAG